MARAGYSQRQIATILRCSQKRVFTAIRRTKADSGPVPQRVGVFRSIPHDVTLSLLAFVAKNNEAGTALGWENVYLEVSALKVKSRTRRRH